MARRGQATWLQYKLCPCVAARELRARMCAPSKACHLVWAAAAAAAAAAGAPGWDDRPGRRKALGQLCSEGGSKSFLKSQGRGLLSGPQGATRRRAPLRRAPLRRGRQPAQAAARPPATAVWRGRPKQSQQQQMAVPSLSCRAWRGRRRPPLIQRDPCRGRARSSAAVGIEREGRWFLAGRQSARARVRALRRTEPGEPPLVLVHHGLCWLRHQLITCR